MNGNFNLMPSQLTLQTCGPSSTAKKYCRVMFVSLKQHTPKILVLSKGGHNVKVVAENDREA